MIGQPDAGGKAGGGTGHAGARPRASDSMAQLHPYVNGIDLSPQEAVSGCYRYSTDKASHEMHITVKIHGVALRSHEA